MVRGQDSLSSSLMKRDSGTTYPGPGVSQLPAMACDNRRAKVLQQTMPSNESRE